MSLLILNIEVPQDSAIGAIVPQMCALAERMRVIVVARHKGITVMAGPGDNPHKIIEQYTDATRQGRKIALVHSGS